MREAKMENWSIVFYPDIYDCPDTPEQVYATFQAGRPISLFGRAKDDPRYNPATGAFKDGNRLVSAPIVKVENGLIFTNNTVWSPGKISDQYLDWCKQHGHTVYKVEDCEIPVQFEALKKEEDRTHVTLRHICEVCGKDEILTSKAAFDQGWDYPPMMGAYSVISPRKCGDCSINDTLWWEISCNKVAPENLSDHHRATMQRILTEPASIMP